MSIAVFPQNRMFNSVLWKFCSLLLVTLPDRMLENILPNPRVNPSVIVFLLAARYVSLGKAVKNINA